MDSLEKPLDPIMEDLFQLAPLLGLTSKPLNLMTPEERREMVVSLHDLRNNRVEFNKRARARKDNSEADAGPSRKTETFNDFDVDV